MVNTNNAMFVLTMVRKMAHVHVNCQGMRYMFMSYALLAITELPNNEMTGIHTLNLSPLLLWLLMSSPLYFRVNNNRL